MKQICSFQDIIIGGMVHRSTKKYYDYRKLAVLFYGSKK